MRLAAARILVELDAAAEATVVLDRLLAEDDTVMEVRGPPLRALWRPGAPLWVPLALRHSCARVCCGVRCRRC